MLCSILANTVISAVIYQTIRPPRSGAVVADAEALRKYREVGPLTNSMQPLRSHQTSVPMHVLRRSAGNGTCVTTKTLHRHRHGQLSDGMCVTTETRHLDRLGQLGEFEQDSNTDSELGCVANLQRRHVITKHQITLHLITKHQITLHLIRDGLASSQMGRVARCRWDACPLFESSRSDGVPLFPIRQLCRCRGAPHVPRQEACLVQDAAFATNRFDQSLPTVEGIQSEGVWSETPNGRRDLIRRDVIRNTQW